MEPDSLPVQPVIKNARELATTDLRRDALAIAEAGYAAINTQALIKRMVRLERGALCVGAETCELGERAAVPERIFFVGVGKCAADAAVAMEEVLGEHLTGGIILDVSVSAVCRAQLKKIQCFEGTHPLPSETNIEATKHILDLLHGLTERDTVIVLVSGGGSTLLCQPASGGTCADEILVFKELTARGADIHELNLVRKHLSLARGGGLARAAYPATIISLIISDVVGDDLAFIASGPTVRDESTIADALAVLKKYSAEHLLPEGLLMETPKEERYFARVTNLLLASNRTALEAMQKEADTRGYAARVATDHFTGEARDVARDIASTLHQTPPKTVLLYGGETVVTAQAGETLHGNGGRNLELSVAALQYLQEGELILPFASDGRDNGDAAGAIADIESFKAAQIAQLSIPDTLRSHASLDFFTAIKQTLLTGETGSNVSDLVVAIKQ